STTASTAALFSPAPRPGTSPRTTKQRERGAACRQGRLLNPIQRRWVMFEKVGRLAEAAASRASVSRRGFLGRLGQGALAAAGVLGGLLLATRQAGGAPARGGPGPALHRPPRARGARPSPL